MLNPVTLYCIFLNHANFFLLERVMSELQVLYQTYFSKMNLRRRKRQKLNTPKNVLATSLSMNIIFYFLLVFLYSKRNEKVRSMMIFVQQRVLFLMVCWNLNLLLVFIPINSFFWNSLSNFVVLSI